MKPIISIVVLSSLSLLACSKKEQGTGNVPESANTTTIPQDAKTDTALLPGAVNAPFSQDASYLTATGIIVKAGTTTYQYGNYVLEVNNVRTYALTSDKIDLKDYLGRQLTISGHKVAGYPVDGGPDFINVEAIVD